MPDRILPPEVTEDIRALLTDAGVTANQDLVARILATGVGLGLDGTGLVLVLLTAALLPILLLAAWKETDPENARAGTYVALTLAVEAMVLVSFVTTDVLLFYLLFEAMLIPLYFLVGSFGGANRGYAAVKFLIYNLVGGLLMLAAIVGLYVVSARAGDASYLITDDTEQKLIAHSNHIAHGRCVVAIVRQDPPVLHLGHQRRIQPPRGRDP